MDGNRFKLVFAEAKTRLLRVSLFPDKSAYSLVGRIGGARRRDMHRRRQDRAGPLFLVELHLDELLSTTTAARPIRGTCCKGGRNTWPRSATRKQKLWPGWAIQAGSSGRRPE